MPTSIVDQWRDRIGLGAADGEADTVDGHRRTTWRDCRAGRWSSAIDVAGMGHGTPLATRGKAACGVAGPHMLEAGICSTSRIAGSWGLTGKTVTQPAARPAPKRAAGAAFKPASQPRARAAASPRAKGVGAVIEDALRAAGLMR